MRPLIGVLLVAFLWLAGGCGTVPQESATGPDVIKEAVKALRETGAKQLSTLPMDCEAVRCGKYGVVGMDGRQYEAAFVVFKSSQYGDRYAFFEVRENGRRLGAGEELALILEGKIPHAVYAGRWCAKRSEAIIPTRPEVESSAFTWVGVRGVVKNPPGMAPGTRILDVAASGADALPYFVVETTKGNTTRATIYPYTD